MREACMYEKFGITTQNSSISRDITPTKLLQDSSSYSSLALLSRASKHPEEHAPTVNSGLSTEAPQGSENPAAPALRCG